MNSIPTEKLPDYFKDESRRNVLYAPLRNKSVNPNDWNFKINSWSQLISLYCSCNKVYSFSLESLKKAFYDNGRTPSCLREVLQQMLANGDINSLDVFLQEKPKSWKHWVTSTFVSAPFSWTMGKMRNLISSNTDDVIYVPLKVLEQDGDQLIEKFLVNYKNKILSMKEFLEIENNSSTKAKDFKILFISLYNRKKLDLLELQNKDMSEGVCELDNFLIKFSDSQELRPISEVDLGMRTLEEHEQNLQKDIEILEDDISSSIKEAKSHLLKGHKLSAKACLRKKHDLENRIDKKMKALHNVQILLSKLYDTKINESTWKSYKDAVKAFEVTYKKGINEDAVEDTMLRLGEMLEIHSDIESALARPVIDIDADLEEELEQLLQDDNENTFNDNNKGSPQKKLDEELIDSLKKLDLKLPSVPTSPVSEKSEEYITTEPTLHKVSHR